MKSLTDARDALAELVGTDDVPAYTDARKALGNRPCLLIGHPTVDKSEGTMRAPMADWPVFALSSYQAEDVQALGQLEDLIAAVDAAVGLDKAEPIQFRVKDSTVAAYQITVSDFLQ